MLGPQPARNENTRASAFHMGHMNTERGPWPRWDFVLGYPDEFLWCLFHC